MIFNFYRKRLELQAKLDTLQIQLDNKNSEWNNKMKDKDSEAARKITEREHILNLRISTMESELVQAKKIAKEEHDIKLQEILSLTKLESEQKIAKIRLETEQKLVAQQTAFDKKYAELENSYIKKFSAQEAANAAAVSNIKQEEAGKYHDRLAKALDDLHTKGSAGTKMMHELSLALVNAARPGVNESRFLTGRIDGREGNDPTIVVSK